jgi:very-short-patch-repair endonuclease
MSDNLHKGANSELFYYARQNRQVMTKAEKILWSHLRNRKYCSHKFRRQHPIADFIADFYCAERSLVIEIDGGYHNEPEQKQYDEGRTFELEELNVKVIRFTNKEVLENIDYVLSEIATNLKSLHP